MNTSIRTNEIAIESNLFQGAIINILVNDPSSQSNE